MEDKEKIINRVVGFLYDALDNFKSTMEDVNTSLGTLMDSLKKVERDLQTLGVQPSRESGLSSDQIAARIKAGSSMSSRERLINLFSGSPISSESKSSSLPTATATTETVIAKPAANISGPPKPTQITGPPKVISGTPKPIVGPPTVMKPPIATTGPPKVPSMKPPIVTTGPPKVPSMKPPIVTTTPPTIPAMKPPPITTSAKPPIMKPPTPTIPNTPTAPSTDSAKPSGSSIIGLRDEMLKELKRLKSIMKGG